MEFKGEKHCNRLKSQSFFFNFFSPNYTPDLLKICTMVYWYKSEIWKPFTKIWDLSFLLRSLSNFALLKKYLEVVDSPEPKRYKKSKKAREYNYEHSLQLYMKTSQAWSKIEKNSKFLFKIVIRNSSLNFKFKM